MHNIKTSTNKNHYVWCSSWKGKTQIC